MGLSHESGWVHFVVFFENYLNLVVEKTIGYQLIYSQDKHWK